MNANYYSISNASIKTTSSTFFAALMTCSILLFSCGARLTGSDPVATVDSYSINKASQRLCGTSQRLVSSSSVLNLDMNSFAAAGGVKTIVFVKGSDSCTVRFTKYDFNSRSSTFAGQTAAVDSPNSPSPTFNYDLTLQNSDANSCISNGSAWEVISTNSTATNAAQIILRNLSDSSTNQTMALNADKMMKANSLAASLGISAYTCQ